MSEIIERVAYAIVNARPVGSQDGPEAMAIAAIKAVRDPGRDFIWDAVYNLEPTLSCIKGHDLGDDEAEKVYQSVIDAILAD